MLPISSSSKNEEEEKEKKIEMNKLDSSNNEPIKIYNSNDFEIPKIEPEYHIGPCLGLRILLCNIIIPGTGTFIACCKMKDPTLRFMSIINISFICWMGHGIGIFMYHIRAIMLEASKS